MLSTKGNLHSLLANIHSRNTLLLKEVLSLLYKTARLSTRMFENSRKSDEGS